LRRTNFPGFLKFGGFYPDAAFGIIKRGRFHKAGLSMHTR